MSRAPKFLMESSTIAPVALALACGASSLADTVIPASVIVQNTTWTLVGSPYIISGDVTIAGGATLTIEPGVVLRPQGIDLLVGSPTLGAGTLVAIGTEALPIILCNYEEGVWDRFDFTDTAVDAVYDVNGVYQSGSILRHIVMYTGTQSLHGAINVTHSSPCLDQIIVAYSLYGGISAEMDGAPPLRLTNSLITWNGYPEVPGPSSEVFVNGGSGHVITGITIDYHDAASPAISIANASNVTFTGNTIAGVVTASPASHCISISNAPGLIFTDNTITGNNPQIRTIGADCIRITNSPNVTFAGNTVQDNGFNGITGFHHGGLYADGVDNMLVQDNTFLHNWGEYGGGAWIKGVGVQVIENVFSENKGGSPSGANGAAALYVKGDEAFVSGNLISANTVTTSPLAIASAFEGSNLVITGNEFSKNVGGAGGAGRVGLTVSGLAANFVFSNNVVKDNSASNPNTFTAGFQFSGPGSVTDNEFTGNHSASNAGAVQCFLAGLVLTGNLIEGNSSEKSGGGLAIGHSITSVTLIDNVITNNTAAVSGGGIALIAGTVSLAGDSGAGVFNVVANNEAPSGSAVYNFPSNKVPINAEYVCWGSNDPVEVQAMMSGLVDFDPIVLDCGFGSCPSDLDGDGTVSGADITFLLGEWGVQGKSPADINGDGVVDGADITSLLGAWGEC